MNSESQPRPPANPAPAPSPATLKSDPDAVCSECGVFGAYDFDGVKLCGDCYTQKGSCCCESSMDDC